MSNTLSSKSKLRRKIQNFKTNAWQESIGLNFSIWIPLCARVFSHFFLGGCRVIHFSAFVCWLDYYGLLWITCDLWFWPPKYLVWVVVSNIFYFYPYLGKIPILTNIFQRGWNHQLVVHGLKIENEHNVTWKGIIIVLCYLLSAQLAAKQSNQWYDLIYLYCICFQNLE